MTDLIPLTGAAIIGGRIVEPTTADYRAVNPTDGSQLDPGSSNSTSAEVAQSCQLAAEAFTTDGTHATAAVDLLMLWADLIDSHIDQIVARADQETALGEVRLRGEVARTTTQMRFVAGRSSATETLEPAIDRAKDESTPPLPNVSRINQPIGPVAVFGASNFPLAFSTPGGDTTSALAAGCPVVVKAHPAHPGTSELVGRLAVQAITELGLHPAWFSMLTGNGYEVGLELVCDPAIQAVAFTGSLNGGRAIYDAASQRPSPIPVFAEMGSLNPTFVFPSSLNETTANALAASLLIGVGQFCTKPGVIVVPNTPDGAEFTELIGKAMSEAPAGTMLTPAMANGLKGLVNETLSEDVRVVSEQAGASTTAGMAGILLETDLDAFLTSSALNEEHFGPVGLIVKANIEDYAKLFDAIDGALSATVFAATANETGIEAVIKAGRLHAGRVVFNQPPTGIRVCSAIVHGGPYPATTAPTTSSVGAVSIKRFLRPVAYQNFPDGLLPEALQASNPLELTRLIDGVLTQEPLS